MEQLEQMNANKAGLVSAALMGAAAGTVAVWALDRVDWFMWRRVEPRARAQTTRVRPGGEAPSHALVSKIEQFAGLKPTERQHDMAGDIAHYAIGIAPAAGYALMREKMPGRGMARGTYFGLGMFLAQDEALNSLTGLAAKPSAYPWQAHARGLVAHIVYGVTTEFVLNAIERRARTFRARRMQGE